MAALTLKPDIQYIYFDFDNVLAKRAESRSVLAARLLGMPDSARLRQFYFVDFHHDPQLEQRYSALRTVPEEHAFYQDLFRLFAQREGMRLSEQQIQAAAEAFVQVPFVVLPGVRQSLEYLRQSYALGIFTNGLPSRHQEIEASGLGRYFRDIVISCDYGVEKPASGSYEIAAKIAGVEAAQLALVDDEPENIAGAERAGYGQAILLTPAFWQQER